MTRLRILALFLLVFCLLSNARGLVPGMCATLAAAERGAAKAACCESDAVCNIAGVSTERRATNTETSPSCAFCKLAKGFLEVQDYVYCDEPAGAVMRAGLLPPKSFSSTEPRHAARPRDPPSSLTLF